MRVRLVIARFIPVASIAATRLCCDLGKRDLGLPRRLSRPRLHSPVATRLKCALHRKRATISAGHLEPRLPNAKPIFTPLAKPSHPVPIAVSITVHTTRGV